MWPPGRVMIRRARWCLRPGRASGSRGPVNSRRQPGNEVAGYRRGEEFRCDQGPAEGRSGEPAALAVGPGGAVFGRLGLPQGASPRQGPGPSSVSRWEAKGIDAGVRCRDAEERPQQHESPRQRVAHLHLWAWDSASNPGDETDSARTVSPRQQQREHEREQDAAPNRQIVVWRTIHAERSLPLSRRAAPSGNGRVRLILAIDR